MAKKKDPSARNATYNTGANPDELDWSGFNTGESVTASPEARTERTLGEAAYDTGVGVVKGLAKGAHDITNFASLLVSPVVDDDQNSGIIDEAAKWADEKLQAQKSEIIRLKEQRLGAMIQDPNVTVTDVLGYVGNNTDLLGQITAESLPSLAIGAGVTGALAKVNAIRQFAASGKVGAALVGSVGETAQIAGSIYGDTESGAHGAAGIAMGVATGALPGNVGGVIARRIAGRADDVLDPVAEAAQRGAVGRWMSGDAIGTGVARTATATGIEAGQEFVQEGAQALIEQHGKTGEFDTASALKQGAVGALAGGIMGGGAHVMIGEGAVASAAEIEAVRLHQQQAQQALAADPTNPVLQNEVESARAAVAAATTSPAQRQQVADVAAAASATEIMGASDVDSAVDSFNQANQTSAALRTGAQIAEEAGAAIREMQGSFNPATAEFDTTPAPATVTPGGPTPAGVTAAGTEAVASTAPGITPDEQTITPAPAAGRPLMASATIQASVPPGTPSADAILQVANWRAGRDPVTNISRIVAGMAGDPNETQITRPPGISPVVWETFVRDAQMETGIMLQHDGGIGRTVRQGLQDIATGGSRPGRMLAERLLATNSPYLNLTVGAMTGRDGARGRVFADSFTGRITSMEMSPTNSTESAYLHESLHALTLSWLDTVPHDDPMYRELKQLVNKVRREADSRGMTFYGTHPGGNERTKMAEFLAEAFTRSTFQTFLDSIQVESHRTGWDTFVGWVGRLIGTTEPRQLSALDLALRINDQVLNQSAEVAGRLENQAAPEPTPAPVARPASDPDAHNTYRQFLIGIGNSESNATTLIEAIRGLDEANLRNMATHPGYTPELRTYAQALLDAQPAAPAAPADPLTTAREAYMDSLRRGSGGASQELAEEIAAEFATRDPGVWQETVRRSEYYTPEVRAYAQALLDAQPAAAQPPAATSTQDRIALASNAFRYQLLSQGFSESEAETLIGDIERLDNSRLQAIADDLSLDNSEVRRQYVQALLDGRGTRDPYAAARQIMTNVLGWEEEAIAEFEARADEDLQGIIDTARRPSAAEFARQIIARRATQPAAAPTQSAPPQRRTRQTVVEAEQYWRDIERQNGASASAIDSLIEGARDMITNSTTSVAAIEREIQSLEDANSHSEAEFLRALLDTLAQPIEAFVQHRVSTGVTEAIARESVDVMSQLSSASLTTRLELLEESGSDPAKADLIRAILESRGTANGDALGQALATAREGAIQLEMDRYGFSRAEAENEVEAIEMSLFRDSVASIENRITNMSVPAWSARRTAFMRAVLDLRRAGFTSAPPSATPTGPAPVQAMSIADAMTAYRAWHAANPNRLGADQALADYQADVRTAPTQEIEEDITSLRGAGFGPAADLLRAVFAHYTANAAPVTPAPAATQRTYAEAITDLRESVIANLRHGGDDVSDPVVVQTAVDSWLNATNNRLEEIARDYSGTMRTLAQQSLAVREAAQRESINTRQASPVAAPVREAARMYHARLHSMDPQQVTEVMIQGSLDSFRMASDGTLESMVDDQAIWPESRLLARNEVDRRGQAAGAPARWPTQASTPAPAPTPAPQLTAAQRAARTRAQNRFMAYLPTAYGQHHGPTDDSNRQIRSETLRRAVANTVRRLRRHPHSNMHIERDRAVRGLVNNMGADAAERWMIERIHGQYSTTPTINITPAGAARTTSAPATALTDYNADVEAADRELQNRGHASMNGRMLDRAFMESTSDLQAVITHATGNGLTRTLALARAIENRNAVEAGRTAPNPRFVPTATTRASAPSASTVVGADAFPTRARRMLGTGVLEKLVNFWRGVMGEPGQWTMGDIDISDLIGQDTQHAANELAQRYNDRLHEKAVAWAREHGEPAPAYVPVVLSITNARSGPRGTVRLDTRGLARRGNPFLPQLTPVPVIPGYTWRESTDNNVYFDDQIHASSLAGTPGSGDFLYRIAADMARIKGGPGFPSDATLSTVNNLRRQMQGVAASLRTGNPNLINPLTSGRNEGPQAIPPAIWNAASDEEKIGLNILRTIESVIGHRGDGFASFGKIYSNLRLQPDGTFLAIGAPNPGGVADGTTLTFAQLKDLVSSSRSFVSDDNPSYRRGGVGAGAASFAIAANTVAEALEHDINSTLPDALRGPITDLGRANEGWFFSRDEAVPDRDYQTEIDSLMAEHAMPDTTNERRAEINAEIATIQDEQMNQAEEAPYDAEASDRMLAELGQMAEAGAGYAEFRAAALYSMDQGVPSDSTEANSPAAQAAISTQPVSPASQNEIRIMSEKGKGWVERLSNYVRKAIQDKHVTLGGILRALRDTRTLKAIDRFDGLRQAAFERLASEPMAEIENILNAAGISRADFENHLIQRHVREYNTHIIAIAPLQITRDPNTGEETVRGYDHETRPASGVDENGEPYTSSRADTYMEQEHNPAMLEAAEAYTRMIRGLQNFAVESGLESHETVDRWNKMFPNYVPFRRDLDVEEGMGGTGSGFSVREGISQRAMGSTAALVDPLPATLEMMVRVVDRGEKARIGQTMLATARSRPIPMYQTRRGDWRAMWRVESMPNIRSVKRVRVYNVTDPNGQPILNGARVPIEFYNGADARAYAATIQRSANQNQATGQNPIRVRDTGFHDRVVMAHNPAYINKDNVLVIPENGENHVLVFDEQSEQAMDMVRNLKNLDSAQLNGVFKVANVFSRWTVGTATGYNPFFAPINFIRDIQASAVNMASTDVPGWTKRDSAKLMADAAKNAPSLFKYLQAKHRATHSNQRAAAIVPAAGSAAEWMEFAKASGGLTGIRESFATFEDAVNSVQHLFGEGHSRAQRDPRQRNDLANRISERAANEYDDFTRWLEGNTSGDGRLKAFAKFTSRAPVAISNLNNAFELATRVAAFKSAFEKYQASGLSREEAAEKAAVVSKNVSVNFNRRGTMTSQMNALFPFFNAASQGSARLGELLFEKVRTADTGSGVGERTRLTSVGKKVIAALPALGAMQAMMLAAAGFEDDQPPEHVRSRNLIIPTGGKGYVMMPLPLGLNSLFNMGREGMDAILYPKNAPKHLLNMVSEPLTAFNPLGSTPNKALVLSPAALDIPLALYMNEDAFGRQIFKEDRDPRRPTPGFTRHKEGTSESAIAFAEALNKATGGNEYKGGAIDITGDQVEYLLGQLGGGITREAMKTGQFAAEKVTGSKPDEDRPWYKVPLAGKFIGDVGDSASVRDRLYKLSAELNSLNSEYEGLKDSKKRDEARALRSEHPELDKRDEVEKYFNAEAKLRKERAAAQRDGKSDRVAEINEKLRVKGEALVLEIEKIKVGRTQ